MALKFAIIRQLGRLTILVIPVAVLIGGVIALFLFLLNTAIHYRFNHPWLLFLLPVAGLAIHFIYQIVGKSAEKGNNLIIKQIEGENHEIPKRMAPIILITTLITHLFGGSAGREGTAVQIGGSIASMVAAWFNLNKADLQMMLMAGVAAGFGAVFGTPVTGAIFAIEVLTIGKLKYSAFLPALIAALLGNFMVGFCNISHVQYHIELSSKNIYQLVEPFGFFELVKYTQAEIVNFFDDDILLIVKVIVSSAVFGLASFLFAKMVHEIKIACFKVFRHKWIIPILGGLIIIGLTLLIGKPDYLSLGTEAEYHGAVTISSAFHSGGSNTWSWLWKAFYTAVTLGTGFKGGEVTPLFYIGATLGNTMSTWLNAPVSLFAALGFIGVFAGATNTPVACTMMGIELFGFQYAFLFALTCFVAYFFSGHSGIYSDSRIACLNLFDDFFLGDTSRAETVKRRHYIKRKLHKYM